MNGRLLASRLTLAGALSLLYTAPGSAEQEINVLSHLDTATTLGSLSLEQQQVENQRLAQENVLRIAYVVFDPTELYERAKKGDTEALVRFELFPDVVVEERLQLEWTLRGRWNNWTLHDPQRGSAKIICPSSKLDRITLSGGREHRIEDCAVRVWPSYDGPRYSLRKIRGEPHLWALDEAWVVPTRDVIKKSTPPADRQIEIPSDPPKLPSSASTFEFVALYTEDIVLAGWSPNGIEGQMLAEINDLNDVLANNNLPFSAALKSVEPYPFAGCCVGAEDLPEVFALRLGWGADIGVLFGTSTEITQWAQSGAPVCAAANAHTDIPFNVFPEYAMVGYTPEVTTGYEGCDTLTLAHELGHMVGGCHQFGAGGSDCTPHDPNASYAFASFGQPPQDYVTVLGVDCPLGSCTVTPVFSQNGGVWGADQRPIGSPSANMVATFNANGGLVADLVDGERFNTVRVEREGTGAEGGWVESLDEITGIPDGRIACGDRCADSYRLGTRVTLRVDVGISQANGAEFVQWLGDCEPDPPPPPGDPTPSRRPSGSCARTLRRSSAGPSSSKSARPATRSCGSRSSARAPGPSPATPTASIASSSAPLSKPASHRATST